MIRRIILKNYMSHAESVIEMADGLTVLVGPNNCGKSAIVSALQTLCENDKGDFMVRHGEKECSVTVETSDGHVVTWRRGSKSSVGKSIGGKSNASKSNGTAVSYTVDGEEISRVRGTVPEKLHQVLRLPVVESNDDGQHTFDIHFGTQKDPIFLLNQPASKAAVFFAASSDASRLMEMQRLHKQKVRDASRRQKELLQRRVMIERQLVALEPVDQLDALMNLAEEEYEQARTIQFASAELDGFVNGFDRCLDDLFLHLETEKALSPLLTPPTLQDEQALTRLIEDIEQQKSVINWSMSCLSALREAKSPPEFLDTTKLAALNDRLQHEFQGIESQAAKEEVLSGLGSPPDRFDSASMDQLVSDYEQVAADLGRIMQEELGLRELQDPPVESSCSDLVASLDQIELAQRAVDLLDVELMSLTQNFQSIEAEFKEWVRSHPKCHVCGAPVDMDRLIAGLHSHPGSEPGFIKDGLAEDNHAELL